MDSPPLPLSASPPAQPSPTETSSRPPLTINAMSSHFVDSALGTSEICTPSPKRKTSSRTHPSITLKSPSKTTKSISGRLEQLAALAWEAEEDDRLDEQTRASVQSQLHAIEAQLEGRTRGNEQTSSDVDLSNSATPNASSASSILEPSISQGTPAQEPRETRPDVPDLSNVLEFITSTVASMRARLTESKHLHVLALSKLSSIAQSNLNLTTQLSQARQTTTSLSHANAALRMHISDLEATTTQQSVTVSAMTGAVAGLESYVRSSSPSPHTPRNTHAHLNGSGQHTPNSGARRQTVVRGTGRFRGKYPAGSPAFEHRDSGSDANMNLDGATAPAALPASQQNDLQEGVLGWIRGFRDVEAGWREMDLHRSPTRFGNIIEREVGRMPEPETPTRRAGVDIYVNGIISRSYTDDESVLMQGDKVAGSDVFGQEDEFGDFQTVTSG